MENLNFVAIDLETATFDRSSICEIGIAVVKNSKIVDKHSWLVKPKDNHYNPWNKRMHGITSEMTEDALSFKDIWKKVYPYLKDTIVVSHNAGFDMYALRDAFENAGMEYPTFIILCSLRMANYTIESDSYSLDSLTNLLGIDLPHHYRATDGSVACAEIFIETIKRASVLSINELENKYSFKHGLFDMASHRFISQLSTKKKTKYKLKDIEVNPTLVDPGSYFYEKRVCLTGKMIVGTRNNIFQAIADIGGFPTQTVSNKTDVLVVGIQNPTKVGENGISSKHRIAKELNKNGAHIEIMTEDELLRNIQIPELINSSNIEKK